MTSNLSDGVFLRRLLLTALVVALLVAAWLLSPLLLIAFGAVLIAMALRALAQPMVRAGLPDTWAIVLTMALIIACLIAAVVFFGSEMMSQWQALNARLGSLLAEASKRLGVNSIEELVSDSGASSGIATLLPRFLSWGASLGQAVFGAGVMLVGAAYLAVDPKTYREGVLKLIPPDYQANAIATIEDIGAALHRWLGGVLVAMVLVGLMTGLGLWIAGVQSPLALGLLAGLANAVPYIGSIAAAVVTIAISAGQSWEAMAGAVVVMFIVQQVESNLITPLVVGGAVAIPPATGLFAIVAMGMLFGPLGVLLGFPLSIVIDIAVRRLYIRDALDEPVEILGDAAQRSDNKVTVKAERAG